MNNTNIYRLKPDFDEARRRSEAYWAGDVIGRPILRAVLRKSPDYDYRPEDGYRERIYGDLDELIANRLHNAEHTLYLGESMPSIYPSLSPHEIAAYCGYELEWAGYTNWCRHDPRPLAELLPLKIDENGYMFKRILTFYDRISDTLQGEMLSYSFDFHSNLDLLLSVRGDVELCYDTIDCPEEVERGVANSCEIFRQLFSAYVEHAKPEEYGYYFDLFSERPTTTLACDFAALISEEMFWRFAVPALTYESEVVGERAVFHWDGPAALKHFEALMEIPNIHTVSYVPNHYERHTQFLELYQKCQECGKGVVFTGTPEEIQEAHKVLKPNMTWYNAEVKDESEFRQLEKWLAAHT